MHVGTRVMIIKDIGGRRAMHMFVGCTGTIVKESGGGGYVQLDDPGMHQLYLMACKKEGINGNMGFSLSSSLEVLE